jgi:hypothetical protein
MARRGHLNHIMDMRRVRIAGPATPLQVDSFAQAERARWVPC